VGTAGRSGEAKKRSASAASPDPSGRAASQWSTDGGHRAEGGTQSTIRTVAGPYFSKYYTIYSLEIALIFFTTISVDIFLATRTTY